MCLVSLSKPGHTFTDSVQWCCLLVCKGPSYLCQGRGHVGNNASYRKKTNERCSHTASHNFYIHRSSSFQITTPPSTVFPQCKNVSFLLIYQDSMHEEMISTQTYNCRRVLACTCMVGVRFCVGNGRKCSSGFGNLAVLQLLATGMHSLRRKVWICAPSHCPLAPVLQPPSTQMQRWETLTVLWKQKCRYTNSW